jgi:hypothetical protein
VTTPREEAPPAAASPATDVSQGGPPAPRGLPGLPLRPRGGLPLLPPRPGGGGGAAASGSAPSTGGSAASGAEPAAPGEEAPATGASTTAPPRSAMPALPPRPAAPPPPQPAAAAAPLAARPAAPPAPRPEEPESVKRVRRQVQAYRVGIFRAALRLRYPTRSSMIQQMMYRLGAAERIHLRADPADPDAAGEAHAAAERAEVLAEPLDFSCTVMVLGLAGVGKSAAIRALLGLPEPAGYAPTTGVQVVTGEVSGVRVTFLDTPGLEAGPAAAASNLRRLHAAKRAWNRHRPSAVLYFDRLDAPRRDQADLPVARAITEVFGPDLWFSTVLAFTHAGAPPPDGAQGAPVPVDAFHQQRSAQLQQVARQVSGDNRLMNPVVLVDASPTCPRSGEGEPVLPSGVPWRRQLLMLCFTTKVLNEANSLLKPGAGAGARGGGGGAPNPFGAGGMKVPPMGWLLSRLVDFRGPRKAPEEERELKRDDELEALPPAERAAALRARRMYLKAKAEEARAADAPVPILAPEPQLGPSFDADVGSHHYRVLEDPSSLLVRPMAGEGGVDHEEAVESVHVEKQAVLRPRGQHLGGVPFLGYVQATKDKNQFACQAQVEGSHHHSSRWASTAELNVQTIGRDVLYTHRLESRLRTGAGRRNKVTAGLLASKLGEDYTLPLGPGALAYGFKLDDRLKLSPNAKLRGSVGRIYTKMGAGGYDSGTAAAADLKLRPGGDPSTRLLLGASAVLQRRDTTVAGNVATEFRLPKAGARGGKSETMLSANAAYNNKGNGSLSCRLNSHDYPQLAAAMAVPLLKAAWDRVTQKEEF